MEGIGRDGGEGMAGYGRDREGWRGGNGGGMEGIGRDGGG